MDLNYDFNIKDGMFKYKCHSQGSHLYFNLKYIEDIYNIFLNLNILYNNAKKNNTNRIIYKNMVIIFSGRSFVKIEEFSNWLDIEIELNTIKSLLKKYYKREKSSSIKNIIVKIKSLKKGSSNIIKEELKWEKLLFQER